jgi:hypothetical protein
VTAIAVVGIGASAGGIEAFHRFFENAPSDSGMAFIVVLHLAPGRKSLLPEIIARWTAMPVAEARDGDAIEPDHVYVIPAGAVARLQRNRISLSTAAANGVRESTPIDVFFNSLAENLKEDAVGVVLSGTGHDGALGLKAIRTHGGLTLAQSSNGSKPDFASMPESAVAAGAVDLVVPVEQMVGNILSAREAREDVAKVTATSQEHLNEIRLAICDILLSQIGHDFSHYKDQTFMRRPLQGSAAKPRRKRSSRSTNAVKYGALSVDQGQVNVFWTARQAADGQLLTLNWNERNGPPVAPSPQRNFGMTMIERGMTHDLGGEARIDFVPDGIQVALTVPLRSDRASGQQ